MGWSAQRHSLQIVGVPLLKMGIKFKIPSDCERKKKRTAQHPCYNIQPWLTSETFVLPSCICLTAILHRLWLWKYWIFAMDIEELYGHIYMIIFEYGWVPADSDSWQFMSEVKPLLFQSCWCPILFQNSDIVPELRYCSRLVDARHWAKMLGLLLLLLLLQRSQPQSVARDSILHSQ